MTFLSLMGVVTRRPVTNHRSPRRSASTSAIAVWKVVIPPERDRRLRTHAGYAWLSVLAGELRIILGEHDITMRPGEVAEFDTACPTGSAPPATSRSRSSASTAPTDTGCTSGPRAGISGASAA
jgi:hypothetical protein